MAAFIAVRDAAVDMVTIGSATKFSIPEAEWRLMADFRDSQWSKSEKKFAFTDQTGSEVVTVLRQRGHVVHTEDASRADEIYMPECRVCGQPYRYGTLNDRRICVSKDEPEHVMDLTKPHLCTPACRDNASAPAGAA